MHTEKLKYLWADFKALWRRPTSFALIMGTSTLVFFLIASVVYNSSNGFKYKMLYTNFGKGQMSYLSSPSPPAKHQVLLITYGRSGSTFTSALINHHKDVFFTFEPLYVLKMQSLFENNKINDSIAIVNAFLTCNFPAEYVYALDNTQHRNSDATRDFYKCISAKQAGTSHLSCFLQFVKSCENHRISFVKTIRFKVAWAEWFLEINPNFKLLYLMRDPRATLYSQAQVFRNFAWEKDIGNVSKQHCALIENDLTAAERLKNQYPGRVKGIRYENGALEPFDYTKAIYEFLGLEYNADVEKYIKDLTNHTAKDKRTKQAYGVVRENSTKTMDKWRYAAGFNNVKQVDESCGYLYPKLGYEAAESQKDLESQRSLVRAPDPGSIFS